MEKALKNAIRQGGIKNLPYEEQILVARALIIIKAIPESDYKETGNEKI